MKKFQIYLPLLLSVVLSAGLYLGYRIGTKARPAGSVFYLPAGTSGKLDTILKYIEEDYVDTVNSERLENNAINGMLEKLDPHSQYITTEEFHEMNDPLLGSFEGIGVSFRIEKDTITIINPVKGGPSEKVGIMAGDRIVKINDSLVADIKIVNRDAMRRLKGKKGTQVQVEIYRRGVSGLLPFTIVRDVIPTYSLDVSYMLNNTTGYIRLNKFAATTHEEFLEAAVRLKEEGMRCLVLDLRGNSGGYLKAATDLADEFLTQGKLIVYTQGKNRPKAYTYANRRGILENDELIILIDEGSASASEIVAGAIQDNDRGTIVRRSFGKGLVQEQLPLRDGSALRLTVARYYTPTGRSIQKPYDSDFEKYHHESWQRYENGEMTNADSVPHPDSLKYTTPKGKVVYGGGGITPDVFVAVETDSSLYFYNRLANSGLIFQFAFDYADSKRAGLAKYKDAASFKQGFVMDDGLFNELLLLAAEKGIAKPAAISAQSRKHIKTLFRAYVGRNILDDEGFYRVFQDIDPELQKALEIARNLTP